MEHRFNADEWLGMTKQERIARCSKLAEEALKLSRGAAPNMQKTYMQLAEQWQALADDIARDTPDAPPGAAPATG